MSIKKKILLVGSSTEVKGGIVSVLKNYLGYKNWQEFEICYIPTHIDANIVKKSLFFFMALMRIKKELKSGDVKLAHVHVSERGSFIRKSKVVDYCKKNHVPVILHHHGAEFEEYYAEANNKTKKMIQDTLGKVDLNIVLSNRLIDTIKSKNNNAVVGVLPNAVNAPNHNMYNKDARNILLLGELNERKGVYLLLEAIEHMDSKLDKDVGLYLCGNGDLERLKNTIREKKLEHRIRYIGWVDQEKKNQILSDTMINVLPSYHEGLPMTILETMGYGIPNLSTRIASIPDVLHENETGLLMDAGNVKQLEDQLWKLITNDELCYQISENAFNLIRENYLLEIHMNKLKNYYRNLIGESLCY